MRLNAAAGLHVPAYMRDDVLRLQYERVGATIPAIYLTVAIITTVAAAASEGGFNAIYNVMFPTLFICAGLVRCLAWFRRKGKSIDLDRARRYLKTTVIVAIGLCLIGAVWTLDAYFETSEARRILAPVFIFMGVFAVAICLTSLPRAAIGIVITALTPVSIAMILASDFAIKALGVSLLVVSLLLIKLLANNFTQMVQSLELQLALKKISETDYLTELANRRAFTEVFKDLMENSGSANSPAVMMIDLDGFKSANDKHGHAAGDAILVEAANRLKSLSKNAACVARLGGDEFAVLFAKSNDVNSRKEQSAAIGAILSMPYVCEDKQVFVGASIGIASCPEDGETIPELLRHADRQLYAMKPVHPSQRVSNPK